MFIQLVYYLVDCAFREGLMKGIYTNEFPYIPGSAVSGVIEEVGSDVTGFQKGRAHFRKS